MRGGEGEDQFYFEMVGAGIFKSGKGKKLPRRNGIWLGRHERRELLRKRKLEAGINMR